MYQQLCVCVCFIIYQVFIKDPAKQACTSVKQNKPSTTTISDFSDLYCMFYFCVRVSSRLWFLLGGWGSPTESHCSVETEVDVDCRGLRYRPAKNECLICSVLLTFIRNSHWGKLTLLLLLPPLLTLYMFLCCNALLHFPWSWQCVVSEGSADCWSLSGCSSTAASAPLSALLPPFFSSFSHLPASFFHQ